LYGPARIHFCFVKAAYRLLEVDEAIQICSGEEGRDGCQGDSGGGLIYNGQVIGIVSWYVYQNYGILAVAFGLQLFFSFYRGYGYRDLACGDAGYPTVYTRVSEFGSWIAPQM
jgi:secreted trypsin-like serine protease